MTESPALLRARSIRTGYGGCEVLRGIDFDLRAGEVVHDRGDRRWIVRHDPSAVALFDKAAHLHKIRRKDRQARGGVFAQLVRQTVAIAKALVFNARNAYVG